MGKKEHEEANFLLINLKAELLQSFVEKTYYISELEIILYKFKLIQRRGIVGKEQISIQSIVAS